MEYNEVLKNRRSIRKFKSIQVENDLLVKIIESATLAPSAHNRQPWFYHILNSDEIIKAGDALLTKKDNNDLSIENTSNIIKSSPSMILIYTNNDSNLDDYLSLGAFINNICLTATNLGLGSLWITNILKAEEEVNNLLNINLKLVSAISIGYQDQFPNLRPRKSIKEITI